MIILVVKTEFQNYDVKFSKYNAQEGDWNTSFKSTYDRRNSEHKQRARTKTHALEEIINIEYRGTRSWCYLGSRCIVSFGSDVKFRVKLPGGLGDIALQPRVPVMTWPPGDVSRYKQTQFLSLERRWRRRRGRWTTVGQSTAAAAEGGPTSRIQVDSETRDGSPGHLHLTSRLTSASCQLQDARVSKSRLNDSGPPIVSPDFFRPFAAMKRNRLCFNIPFSKMEY